MQSFFHAVQVCQAQFGLDHFDVGDGVDLARHVNHVVVFKAAHHIHNRIGLADVGQKLVAQTFAGAGPGHQTSNVDKLHDGGHDAFGLHNGGQLRQAQIGHLNHAHIGFDGAKRVVFSRDAGLGQGIEQGGLADIGQADDAAFQTHENLSICTEW